MKANKNDNLVQQNSRNNNIALLNNKLISLSMTPAKQKSLMKFMETEPVTNQEKKIIKGLLSFKTLSVNQYELIQNIKLKVSRRVKLK